MDIKKVAEYRSISVECVRTYRDMLIVSSKFDQLFKLSFFKLQHNQLEVTRELNVTWSDFFVFYCLEISQPVICTYGTSDMEVLDLEGRALGTCPIEMDTFFLWKEHYLLNYYGRVFYMEQKEDGSYCVEWKNTGIEKEMLWALAGNFFSVGDKLARLLFAYAQQLNDPINDGIVLFEWNEQNKSFTPTRLHFERSDTNEFDHVTKGVYFDGAIVLQISLRMWYNRWEFFDLSGKRFYETGVVDAASSVCIWNNLLVEAFTPQDQPELEEKISVLKFYTSQGAKWKKMQVPATKEVCSWNNFLVLFSADAGVHIYASEWFAQESTDLCSGFVEDRKTCVACLDEEQR